jgi:two-component system sensor histidine kinase HydH
LNLLLNALHAVPAGGTVEVTAESDSTGENILVRVSDDGPGIKAEHLTKIFDPFFTTRAKGTGLGLAIVEKIAENHGGKVFAESPPPGKESGARLTLLIPKE